MKNKLIILNRYFIKIKDIKINNNTFKLLKYHRNKIHYKFIINICKLVYNNLILDKNYNENSGRFYIDKNENKTMHRIYEKFVLNYYKINYQNFTVKSQPIKWQIKNDNFNFIPNMKTDITIYNKEKCLIIDTKYYKEILKEHKGKEIIRPSHLYQIYAYMNNIKFKGNIKGILLYAGTNEIINKNYQKEKFDYKIQDKDFSVRILDLNKEWENIEKQLNEIVEEHFNIVK